jgi:hypothetical protein
MKSLLYLNGVDFSKSMGDLVYGSTCGFTTIIPEENTNEILDFIDHMVPGDFSSLECDGKCLILSFDGKTLLLDDIELNLNEIQLLRELITE